MKYIISFPLGILMIVLSGIACGMESCSYYNVSIWHGNVRPRELWNADALTLGFDYADGRRGWTTNTEAVLRYSQGRLPWLWCDVTRSGKASSCFTPNLKTNGGTK
jgi:hypothetical protein